MTEELNPHGRKRLGKDQPCDSGKIYGHCCSAKEFDYEPLLDYQRHPVVVSDRLIPAAPR